MVNSFPAQTQKRAPPEDGTPTEQHERQDGASTTYSGKRPSARSAHNSSALYLVIHDEYGMVVL
jgi:hypothetical protein